MHFCPICKFMLYTKMEEEKQTLMNYCKNCHWKGELEDQSKCVYSRNYQDDYIANKVFSNQYTILDRTLPRISHTCINEQCATNIQLTEDIQRRILFYNNVNADWDTEVINAYFQPFVEAKSIVEVKRLRLTSLLVICSSEDNKNEIAEFVRTTPLDEVFLQPSDYVQPKKEVLYIKYDNVNMKYLYICCVCNSSWKNN